MNSDIHHKEKTEFLEDHLKTSDQIFLEKLLAQNKSHSKMRKVKQIQNL